MIKNESVIKNSNKIIFGINAGVGSGIVNEFGYTDYLGYYDYYSLSLSGMLGLDIAFPIVNVFAIGPYVSAGLNSYDFGVTFGALTMFRFKNNTAIMVGGGANAILTFDAWGISSRLGFKFPNRIYLFSELTTSSEYYWDWRNGNSYSTDAVTFLIHLGVKLF